MRYGGWLLLSVFATASLLCAQPTAIDIVRRSLNRDWADFEKRLYINFVERFSLHLWPYKNCTMPHIPVAPHLPGITGLLEYRQDTAAPIRELTQVILRGPGTLTFAEREMIATVVSQANECRFCTAAHAAATDVLLGESETCDLIRADFESAP